MVEEEDSKPTNYYLLAEGNGRWKKSSPIVHLGYRECPVDVQFRPRVRSLLNLKHLL
jgi:hypothetical protein